MKIINTSYLETVSDGEKDFILEFIDTFSSTYKMLCQQIREAYSTKDFEQLGQIAHQLKPSLKMLELPSSEEIMQMKDNPEKVDQAMIEKIEKECEIAEQQLTEWANEL